MTQLLNELPTNFPHQPPKGYTYEIREFKRNVLSIWCCNHAQFSYNNGIAAKSIWGFYDTKKRQYYAPINSKKVGKIVDINKTSPYTSMQIVRPMRPTVLSFC